MTHDINNINSPNKPGKGNVIAGVVLLAVGVTFLLKQFDYFFFPGWLFSWPMWLIVIGLYTGAKRNYSNASSIVMILLGVFFLLGKALPGFHIGQFFWPAALIGFGIYLILRRKNYTDDYWNKGDWKHKWDAGKFNYRAPNAKEPIVDYTVKPDDQNTTTPPPANPNTNTNAGPDDFMDAVSIFGGVKKIIFSKNFQGGELVNVFGGAEVDFTQADLNGRIYVDVTQIFGGTKIIVPAHWTVISDISAVFAGVEDKRIRTNAPLDGNKVLVLKGISVFAGIDIRSY